MNRLVRTTIATVAAITVATFTVSTPASAVSSRSYDKDLQAYSNYAEASGELALIQNVLNTEIANYKKTHKTTLSQPTSDWWGLPNFMMHAPKLTVTIRGVKTTLDTRAITGRWDIPSGKYYFEAKMFFPGTKHWTDGTYKVVGIGKAPAVLSVPAHWDAQWTDYPYITNGNQVTLKAYK
jgi:hypothetical protein